MKIKKYSFGIGDRFANQGEAQLKAIIKAKEAGIDITPVWNKSNREHAIIHSEPSDTRAEADSAVKALGWTDDYFVDADHINLSTVDRFLDSSDFFTLDVADYIGKPSTAEEIAEFIENNKKYLGKLNIPGIDNPFDISEDTLKEIGSKFLFAAKEASKIYNYIADKKGAENFIPEVSMDEVEEAQSPVEMFFILSALAQHGVPAQTIAPKFTGRFNKGVDYVGDINQFAKEFEEDLLVIDFSVKEFSLPENLKLSVHSGSDKFAIYPLMGNLIKKYNKGIHVKTAGTTWLEELIGLALAGGEALELARSIYKKGYGRMDELCGPYATVIDINTTGLPAPEEVQGWDGQKYARTLRHVKSDPDYNPNFRQLIHVGYKVAAEYGSEYTDMLKKYAGIVGQQVTENIYDRHIKTLFGL
ncbi:MAG: hypothetical protein JSV22_04995 [Bacteroidales bacterium]|nr:MAG: hypothetical protein JSV22_04995 [Bacteroidales bacterium]